MAAALSFFLSALSGVGGGIINAMHMSGVGGGIINVAHTMGVGGGIIN